MSTVSLLAGPHSRTPEAPPPMARWCCGRRRPAPPRSSPARWAGDSRSVPDLVDMNDVDPADLATAGDVLIVTSTFGDGGPPDNGAEFWSRLAFRRTPPR